MSQPQSSTFGLIEKLSLYSPLIVVTSVFLVSIFSSNIIKGIVYIVFIVIAATLRHAVINPNDKIAQQVEKQIGGFMKGGAVGDCNMGVNKYGDNSTLGLFILTFTAAYICTPMFMINEINFYIIIFFVFYAVCEFFVKSANRCFTEPYGNGLMSLFSNIVAGLLFGMVASSIIYTYQNNWSYTNIVSSNKEVCNMPSEQTFKCGVYKNGEMLASTTG